MQSTKTARQIELRTSLKSTKDPPSYSQNPKAVSEVCARAVAKQEGETDVNGTKLLAEVARADATETTAEIVSCQNGMVDLVVSELRSRVQAKQVDKEKLDHQMDDRKEKKVETPSDDTKGQ